MERKDYYAILMLHPKAEQFLIEAAYRRLVREYHPDVNKAPNAHEHMIEIQEAYAVLSDPLRRRDYDRMRANGAAAKATPPSETKPKERSPQAQSTATASERERPSQKTAAPNGAPQPPAPREFEITPNYYERAVEGAQLWEKRKRVLHPKVSTAIQVIAWLGGFGVTIGAASSGLEWLKALAPFAWFAIPIMVSGTIGALEAHSDGKQLKSVFNPKYNPHPDRYAKYAEAYAAYEAEMVTVHVSSTGTFHSNPWCCGMMSSTPLPKWEAALRYRACSHCGHFTIRPKRLPRPFGPERLPTTPSV
jgi:hypothetical protein